ncbi:MAG TPA: hypothetical protein VIY52_09200 [Streptosporangiaceae bacterium]
MRKTTIIIPGLAALATVIPLFAVPAAAAISPAPLNIVAVGDSYASGEGDIGSGWINASCERSAGAAPQRAAEQLNGVRPATFTSFACLNGVIEGGTPAENLLGAGGQLSQVDPSGTTPVDALTISVGGNDIGFTSILTACMVPGNSCSTDPNVTGELAAGLNNLKYELGDLIGYLNSRTDIDNVFLTAYPDPTTGPNGIRCGAPGPYPGFEGFDFITQPDAQWASTSVIAPLNSELQNAVDEANQQSGSHPAWHFVAGIASAFYTHGFCTGGGSPNLTTWLNPRYVDTPIDSSTSQGDVLGTLHPNDLGQQVIANVMYDDYVDSPLMSASVSAPSTLIAGSPQSFSVQALTFANAPVANAAILVDGNLVGHTDSNGNLDVSYTFATTGDHTITAQAVGYPDAQAVINVQVRPYGATSNPSPIPLSSVPSLTLTATDSGTGQLVAGTFTLKTGAGTTTLRSGATASNVPVTIRGYTYVDETIPGPDGKPITIKVKVRVCPELTFQPDSSLYAPQNFSSLIACTP